MEMLPFGLSTFTKRTVRQTYGYMEFFVDADNGDDSNDGSSWDTAKQTLAAGFGIIPYFVSSQSPNYYTVVLHLKGTFTISDVETSLDNYVSVNGTLLVTGTDDVTIVDDNSGSNYTATSHSTSSLGLATTPWTTDDHLGLIVQILSGPAAGQSRTVQKNTSSAITPTSNWSVDPGTCTFRFVKPATIINTAPADGQYLYLNVEGSGKLVVQKISFEEDVIISGSGNGSLQISHCVCGPNVSVFSYGPSADHGNFSMARGCQQLTIPFGVDSLQKCGVGWTDITTSSIELYRCAPTIMGSVVPAVTARRCFLGQTVVSHGSRVYSLTTIASHAEFNSIASIKNWSSTAVLIFDQGLKFISSSLCLGALTISNVTGSAIEAEDTRLRFIDVVAGTGNTKAGLYVWGRSYVTFTTGKTPTVTGTVGDVSINNSSQKSTWAAIAGGTPVNDTTEMVVVKKV